MIIAICKNDHYFIRKDVYTGSETHQEGLQMELAPILYNIGNNVIIILGFIMSINYRGTTLTSGWEE